jgi:hypothetical protein
MPRLFVITTFLFSFLQCLPAQDILDEPVPWSGQIRRTTVKELIARMTGWAEGSGKEGFVFAKRLPVELADLKVDHLMVTDDPRPTYRQLLSEIFGQVRKNARFTRGRTGIEITYTFQYQIWLSFKKVAQLKRSGLWSTEALKADLKRKGWKLSTHFGLTLLKESQILIIRGVKADHDNVSRYLGYRVPGD